MRTLAYTLSDGSQNPTNWKVGSPASSIVEGYHGIATSLTCFILKVRVCQWLTNSPTSWSSQPSLVAHRHWKNILKQIVMGDKMPRGSYILAAAPTMFLLVGSRPCTTDLMSKIALPVLYIPSVSVLGPWGTPIIRSSLVMTRWIRPDELEKNLRRLNPASDWCSLGFK